MTLKECFKANGEKFPFRVSLSHEIYFEIIAKSPMPKAKWIGFWSDSRQVQGYECDEDNNINWKLLKLKKVRKFECFVKRSTGETQWCENSGLGVMRDDVYWEHLPQKDFEVEVEDE